jgi:hypothetical protein
MADALNCTHQLKAVKGRQDRPWVEHSLGVGFQAFEPDGDGEIESIAGRGIRCIAVIALKQAMRLIASA